MARESHEPRTKECFPQRKEWIFHEANKILAHDGGYIKGTESGFVLDQQTGRLCEGRSKVLELSEDILRIGRS
jgi:hypothetical protein